MNWNKLKLNGAWKRARVVEERQGARFTWDRRQKIRTQDHL
jgi:hypothetical protein